MMSSGGAMESVTHFDTVAKCKCFRWTLSDGKGYLGDRRRWTKVQVKYFLIMMGLGVYLHSFGASTADPLSSNAMLTI